MCPPVSLHKGASIVKIPTHNACIFGMETPLHGRSGGHTGTAPTVSFGKIVHKWLFCLCGMRGKILRSVVGAVPVCPPVSPCRGASIVKIPAHNAVYFWYGNAATRTFGRAHRHRPNVLGVECAGGVNCALRCRCPRRPSRALGCHRCPC